MSTWILHRNVDFQTQTRKLAEIWALEFSFPNDTLRPSPIWEQISLLKVAILWERDLPVQSLPIEGLDWTPGTPFASFDPSSYSTLRTAFVQLLLDLVLNVLMQTLQRPMVSSTKKGSKYIWRKKWIEKTGELEGQSSVLKGFTSTFRGNPF